MLVKHKPRQTNEPVCVIKVRPDSLAIIDECDYKRLTHHKWFLLRSKNCAYAAYKKIIKGHTFYFRMHREISKPTAHQVVHHLNGNTLDNRMCNLVNLTKEFHDSLRPSRRKTGGDPDTV